VELHPRKQRVMRLDRLGRPGRIDDPFADKLHVLAQIGVGGDGRRQRALVQPLGLADELRPRRGSEAAGAAKHDKEHE